MSTFLLIKDSHPSDVRFSKSLSGLLLYIAENSLSARVHIIYWDRYRVSENLPQTNELAEYHSIMPRILSFLPLFLQKIVWLLLLPLFVSIVRLRTLRTSAIYYCADFLSAFPCSIVKLILGGTLIYDIYDEVGLLSRNLFYNKLASFLDFVPHRLSSLIIKAGVNRAYYSQRLLPRGSSHSSIPVIVIPNTPISIPKTTDILDSPPDLLKFLGCQKLSSLFNPSSSARILMAAGYLAEQRGVLSILEFAAEATDYDILFVGNSLAPRYYSILSSLPNTFFLPSIPQSELFVIQSRCLGLFALYDPSRPINRLAMPNKVWDSIICGLPLVVNKEILATADPLLCHRSVAVSYQYNREVWSTAISKLPALRSALRLGPEFSIPNSVNLYRDAYSTLL
ncbi:hypothetical protein KBY57_13545 [Cyanobium sp. Aljojuca 7D2]|uniref:hypothetical protein n=1 Tax=Cyanobium sp. Aljojuca 7D2 TaxID=2823698 RepID=UPI0020CD1B4F|nr:hypothetical protein [Cyanobium sp. Aljojuca 7D2]MCP9892068.1 hypothetical protein [Cyanobium sp. Aljojuca 7D2]